VKFEAEGSLSPLAKYQELAFSRETSWGDFLDAYLSATRRAPRPGRNSLRLEPVKASSGEETTMDTKRVPPAGTKGSSEKRGMKNHPRTAELVEASRAPLGPWQSRERVEKDDLAERRD
jgi:hypothetical protein